MEVQLVGGLQVASGSIKAEVQQACSWPSCFAAACFSVGSVGCFAAAGCFSAADSKFTWKFESKKISRKFYITKLSKLSKTTEIRALPLLSDGLTVG